MAPITPHCESQEIIHRHRPSTKHMEPMLPPPPNERANEPTDPMHETNQMNPVERPGSALSLLSGGDNDDLLGEVVTEDIFDSDDLFLPDRRIQHNERAPKNRSGNHNPEHLHIKEWIKKAKALDQDDRIATSHSFINCSLKIAHSLADQLCKLEEEQKKGEGAEKTKGGGSESNLEHAVPPQGLQWSDFITVNLTTSDHLSHASEGNDVTSNGEEEETGGDSYDLIFDLLPEIFEGDQGERNHGQSALNNQHASDLLPEIFEGHGEGGDSAQKNHTVEHGPDVDYLNISSANLQMVSSNGQSSSGPPGKEDKLMYTYYLGLVFAELFSGGECCNDEGKLGPDPLSAHVNTHDNFRPTNVDAMSIIDALGDDDELFGGGRNDALDESARSDHSVDVDAHNGRRAWMKSMEEKRNKKKATSTLSSSSFNAELLKSRKLPNALCDLIANMVDCSKGDFSGDETYRSMADVRTDLTIMLKDPDIYLHDLDLDEVTKTGLKMDDRTAAWYGRDTELASLHQIFHQSISGACQAAIICGHHGIGKSQLAQEFLQHAKNGGDNDEILLSGKFDKRQLSHPLSPLASAYNKYCEWLTSSDENASMVEKVSNALKQALGEEAYALVKVIPNLSNIIGVEDDEMDKSDGVEDAQKRLGYLFSQFTQVIIQSHDAPLVLYIDNLQWGDQSSIDLIKEILMVSLSSVGGDHSNQFFFLGCFTDEMEDKKDHPIWTMLDSVKDFGLATAKIELDCLDKETVNTMISKKLNLLPRLTRPLTDIVHHKTKGSPFFVQRLMIELSKEGLLRPSLSRCRWEWEEEKIQERGLPEDFVSFLTASLNRLPSQVLLALCTLSCFGSCSGRALVGLEKELGRPLLDPLDYAVAEGFLCIKDEKYHFVDDRVQQAAYNLMKPEERCLHHFSYGLILCSVATNNGDDGLFLIAVGQINLGGPKAATDDRESLAVAKHNLAAGKKAMAMSDFLSAYWFFDYGISFLKKNHWEDQYELSLELFNGAAECALISGEHDSLSILSEQIMCFAKCMDDKHQIFFITVRLLLRRSNLPAAIECGLDALRTLGEDFPDDITPDVVIHIMEDTRQMLEGLADEDLINHKRMTDSKKITVMKFLARLSEPLYMVRPSDQPIVVLKMVQLSLEYGMSPISPLAFVSYGSLLASMGNIREGYRYARLAKVLLNKVGSRQVTGEVIAYFAQLSSYVEPVQSALEFHIEGEKAAMTSGATMYAMLNAMSYIICCFWSGKDLSSVKSQFDKTLIQMKQHNSHLMLVQLMPLYGSMSCIIGQANNNQSSTETEEGFGSIFDTKKLECSLREKNSFQSKPHYFNMMYSAFMFRKYDDMKVGLEKYSNFKIGSWVKVFSASIQTFYEGLVLFSIGRKEKDETLINKGKSCCRAIEKLVKSASEWNFDNKAKLLLAEEQFCDGNFELAETLYDSAVFSAKEHHFLNEEALSNELTGEFFLETKRANEARICFSHAIENYREWGAFAKTEDLEKRLQEISSSENADVDACISSEEAILFEGMDRL